MKTALTSALLLGVMLFGFKADTHFIEAIAQKLEDHTQQHPQEKLYLHTDKPYYAANDTLYFKAYLTHAENNLPDSVSKVLYVDVLNKISGETVVYKTFKAENGYAHGDFFLKDSLEAGVYHLRAYTAWMRNFSDDFFFEKVFRLYHADNKMASYDQSKLRALATIDDFQFLAEGGHLVAGLDNRLAFKAVNILGKGIDTEGFIVEGKDTIVHFGTVHKGMGYVNFKPENGKNYKAFLQDENGNSKPVYLPKIENKGYVMTVDNLSNKDNIKVYISQNTSSQVENMGLIAQQNGNVCTSLPLKVGQKRLMVLVPRTSIERNGLVQLTLFDANNQPIAERLIYENKLNHLNISIESDKKTYRNREKVELVVHVKDHEGKPVQGEFSLSATDAQQVIEEENAENILSYQYLSSDLNTSELKGQIEQPAYYFDPKNESAKAHLDVLMMTQGWRRFDWKDVLNPTKKDLAFLPENGLSIAGKALRPNGKATEKDMNVTLFVKKAKNPTLFALADESGKFRFEGMDFNDTSEVVIQAVRGKNVHSATISLDTWTIPTFGKIQVPFNPIEINEADYQDFKRMSQEMYAFEKELRFKNQLLNQVNIKAKKNEPFPFDPRRLYGDTYDHTFEVTNEKAAGWSNVLLMISGRFPSVSIQIGQQGYYAIIRGTDIAAVYLDGIRTDYSMINQLSPNDIERIDVLKGANAAFFGVSAGSGGVINFLTRRGVDASAVPQNMKLLKIMGYASPKEFYHPKYDKPEATIRPDYRSTLYWNPSIKTEANGKASVSFWSSDSKGAININIEGNTAKGQVGLATKRVGVQ